MTQPTNPDFVLDRNERECICCGHRGHYNGFKRAETEQHFRHGDWICRSYWACVERGRERLGERRAAKTRTIGSTVIG